MREQKVVVAIIQDSQGRFLVTFNPKWGGYAFPMRAVSENTDMPGSSAIQAAEHDLGCRLPSAAATELDYLGRFGVSQRTGEETLYEYWLFAVEPGQALDLLAAPTWNNNPPMFLTHAELTTRTDLTWSTPPIAQEFVENQEVVLSVVTRGRTRKGVLGCLEQRLRRVFLPRTAGEDRSEAGPRGRWHPPLRSRLLWASKANLSR